MLLVDEYIEKELRTLKSSLTKEHNESSAV
jgi:hypothetical protein